MGECVWGRCVTLPAFLSVAVVKHSVWLPSASGSDELLLHTRGHAEDPSQVRAEGETVYVRAELLPTAGQGDTAALGTVTTEQG